MEQIYWDVIDDIFSSFISEKQVHANWYKEQGKTLKEIDERIKIGLLQDCRRALADALRRKENEENCE